MWKCFETFLSYLGLPLLPPVSICKVLAGDVLVLPGAEVPLSGRPPVAHHRGVMVGDVLHHLPLVVDVARHHAARVVHQHLCKFSLTATVTHWPSLHQGCTYLGCLPDNFVKIIEIFPLLIQPSPNSLSSKQFRVHTDTLNIWSIRHSIPFCCCRDWNWNEEAMRGMGMTGGELGLDSPAPAASSWPPRQMWDKQD